MNGHRTERWSSTNWMPLFLVGLLLSGLAGATAMWLLAPRSGKKTRSRIQKQGAKLHHEAAASMEELATEAGDKAHQFTDSVHEGIGEVKQRSQDLIGVGKN